MIRTSGRCSRPTQASRSRIANTHARMRIAIPVQVSYRLTRFTLRVNVICSLIFGRQHGPMSADAVYSLCDPIGLPFTRGTTNSLSTASSIGLPHMSQLVTLPIFAHRHRSCIVRDEIVKLLPTVLVISQLLLES